MDLATPDVDSLRASIKNARQRTYPVRCADRGGTARVTSRSADDARQVGELARKLNASKPPRLRRAADVPAPEKTEGPTA